MERSEHWIEKTSCTWATALLVAVGAGTPSVVKGHQEPFAYVRGAQVEARGEWEVEQWTTARLGKKEGKYVGLDISTEVEYGLTDRLQVALYLNSRYLDIDGAEGGHEVFEDRNRFDFDGISGEIKYQLSNPYQNPWGFALYFEPGYGRFGSVDGEREDSVFLEFKGIVERHFLDHRLVVAFNYTIEPEWERGAGEDWETALEMEWALAAAWKLSPGWHAGLEARFDTEFEDADPEHAEFSSFSVGPTVSRMGENWFATLTVLPQVWGWRDAPGTGGRHLDDREAVEVRLKFGFEF